MTNQISLWTSQFVAMHDEIRNRSVADVTEEVLFIRKIAAPNSAGVFFVILSINLFIPPHSSSHNTHDHATASN